jgi:hypothetical protein
MPYFAKAAAKHHLALPVPLRLPLFNELIKHRFRSQYSSFSKKIYKNYRKNNVRDPHKPEHYSIRSGTCMAIPQWNGTDIVPNYSNQQIKYQIHFAMKKLLFVLISLLSGLAGFWSCKKSSDSPAEISRLLLTKTVTTTTDSLVEPWLYKYDDQNRLIKDSSAVRVLEFLYNNNGTCSKVINGNNYDEFHYQDGQLDFIVSANNNGSGIHYDTTYYEFGSNGLVSRMTGKYSVDTYTYNSNNRVVKDIWVYNSAGYSSLDTTRYEWSATGNLLKKTISSSFMDFVEMTYTYDDKSNYFKTVTFPKEYLLQDISRDLFHSAANNLILRTTKSGNGTYTDVFNITEYNSFGYPVKMNTSAGSVELFYKEL